MQKPEFDFHPVMIIKKDLPVFDFTNDYDPSDVTNKIWGIGRYNEKRTNMYLAPQYENRRNIHMGIDIWAPAGEPVFAILDGEIAYMSDHNQAGNYGATIVTRYNLDGMFLYALHGHLSRRSLSENEIGDQLIRGQKFADLGTPEENGNWPPHLHFQISRDDPGQADMPGVVSDDEIEEALIKYPDPRLVLGKIY